PRLPRSGLWPGRTSRRRRGAGRPRRRRRRWRCGPRSRPSGDLPFRVAVDRVRDDRVDGEVEVGVLDRLVSGVVDPTVLPQGAEPRDLLVDVEDGRLDGGEAL